MSFRFLDLQCNLNELSPLTLAFIGDAVFELFVREEIVCRANRPAKKLHEMSIKKVCCKAQAEKFHKIESSLTEEEYSIYKRGRNATPLHKPKNATRKEYSLATGLEAVFGYIYLKGDVSRLKFLFEKMYNQEGDS